MRGVAVIDPGWAGRGESRLTWELLASSEGTLPVISLHMPTNSSKIPETRKVEGVLRWCTNVLHEWW